MPATVAGPLVLVTQAAIPVLLAPAAVGEQLGLPARPCSAGLALVVAAAVVLGRARVDPGAGGPEGRRSARARPAQRSAARERAVRPAGAASATRSAVAQLAAVARHLRHPVQANAALLARMWPRPQP